MRPITFILFTYNEEDRIEYAVRNFIDHGPILILDGGSTDKTKQIAEELGATFIPRPKTDKPFVENQENLDFIKGHVKTNYIYWGYVDNIAPKPLLNEMKRLAEEGFFKRIHIPMWTYLWGETRFPVQHSELPALFHKDYIDFSDNTIHCFGKFLGRPEESYTIPKKPQLTLRHFSTYNEEKYVAGYMRYGKMEALQKYKNGEQLSILKLFAAMIRYAWIYRRAIRNPRLGTLIILNMAFGRVMTYTRLYEYEHQITIDSIEDRYGKEKEKIL